MSLLYREATIADAAQIQQFLHTHWRPHHILAESIEWLRWQYESRHQPDKLNMMLAMATHQPELAGLLGFIPLNHYHNTPPTTELPHDAWLAIWRVADAWQRQEGGAGLALYHALLQAQGFSSIAAVGINPKVLPFYRLHRFQVERLTHWVLPNNTLTWQEQADRCHWPQALQTPLTSLTTAPVQRLLANHATDILKAYADAWFVPHRSHEGPRYAPHKTADYWLGRYTHHPRYTYWILACDTLRSAVVCRWQVLPATPEQHSRCVLRVIDILGDDAVLCQATPLIQQWCQEEQALYADSYAYGVDAHAWQQTGWYPKPHEGTDWVIPNYFEPFVLENITLWGAYKELTSAFDAQPRRWRLFKGDADQDRPNSL